MRGFFVFFLNILFYDFLHLDLPIIRKLFKCQKREWKYSDYLARK